MNTWSSRMQYAHMNSVKLYHAALRFSYDRVAATSMNFAQWMEVESGKSKSKRWRCKENKSRAEGNDPELNSVCYCYEWTQCMCDVCMFVFALYMFVCTVHSRSPSVYCVYTWTEYALLLNAERTASGRKHTHTQYRRAKVWMHLDQWHWWECQNIINIKTNSTHSCDVRHHEYEWIAKEVRGIYLYIYVWCVCLAGIVEAKCCMQPQTAECRRWNEHTNWWIDGIRWSVYFFLLSTIYRGCTRCTRAGMTLCDGVVILSENNIIFCSRIFGDLIWSTNYISRC